MFRRKLAIGMIIILGLLINAVALGAELSYQVDRSEDDAFKTEAGAYFESSPYVAITDPNYDLFSYFLFRNVTIYNSRIINNATLSVYTTSGQDVDLTVSATIYGLEVGSGGLLDRISITTAFTNWNLSQVRGIGAWHNVTVTDVVQELIDRYNWNYGDDLAFEILAASGALRQAVAFDYGTPPLAAMLYLSYGEAPTPPPGLPGGAEYNQTVEGYDIYKIPGFDQVTSVVTGMAWDDSSEVYPFQGKTAYNNITDVFYIFGVKGDVIGYHFRNRLNLTWSEFKPLYEHVSGGDIYTDYYVDNFGKLHVGWIWTYTGNTYYMKFDLNMDGSATNYTGRQQIEAGNFKAPVTLGVDSEGYPYMAYGSIVSAVKAGRITWSTLNNGTWLHNPNSPRSSEIGGGTNPPNDYTYIHELIPMGLRRMTLIIVAPNPGETYTLSARNQNSANAWTGDGEFLASDRQQPLEMKYAHSGSSVMNHSDSTDARTIRSDEPSNDLWTSHVGGGWGKVNNDWMGETILCSVGLERTGEYVILGHAENNFSTIYRKMYRNETWTNTIKLRTFDSVSNIKLWELVSHQNPQGIASLNKTIVSYAWRDDADIRFYHDWFYVEDGPSGVTSDPYYVAWENGTQVFVCDTLDCLIDLITGTDPDPQDPEPSTWEGSPDLLGRFAMRRYFLMIGWGMFWGPIWLFCYRRPSGYIIGAAFIFMLIGLGLLLQIPYI